MKDNDKKKKEYDWGPYKKIGEMILIYGSIALWLYFIWLITEKLFFN